eukprot:4722550-Amphidinium_carterae.1
MQTRFEVPSSPTSFSIPWDVFWRFMVTSLSMEACGYLSGSWKSSDRRGERTNRCRCSWCTAHVRGDR